MNRAPVEFDGYSVLTEPDLVFASRKLHKHPLLGLIQHGPYSLSLNTPTRLRLALVASRRDMPKLTGLVAELQANAPPKEAKNYYPAYPGFQWARRSENDPFAARKVDHLRA